MTSSNINQSQKAFYPPPELTISVITAGMPPRDGRLVKIDWQEIPGREVCVVEENCQLNKQRHLMRKMNLVETKYVYDINSIDGDDIEGILQIQRRPSKVIAPIFKLEEG